MPTSSSRLLLPVWLSLLGSCAFAQSPPNVFHINLKPNPIIEAGRLGAVQGTADKTGHRFLVEDLTIGQGVAVVLFAQDKNRKMRLQLFKFKWDSPERSGETDSQGKVEFDLKTEGEMKVLVTSENGTPGDYVLVVLVVDELPPATVPSIFVPMPKQPSAHGKTAPPLCVVPVAANSVLMPNPKRRRGPRHV